MQIWLYLTFDLLWFRNEAMYWKIKLILEAPMDVIILYSFQIWFRPSLMHATLEDNLPPEKTGRENRLNHR